MEKWGSKCLGLNLMVMVWQFLTIILIFWPLTNTPASQSNSNQLLSIKLCSEVWLVGKKNKQLHLRKWSWALPDFPTSYTEKEYWQLAECYLASVRTWWAGCPWRIRKSIMQRLVAGVWILAGKISLEKGEIVKLFTCILDICFSWIDCKNWVFCDQLVSPASGCWGIPIKLPVIM